MDHKIKNRGAISRHFVAYVYTLVSSQMLSLPLFSDYPHSLNSQIETKWEINPSIAHFHFFHFQDYLGTPDVYK